MLFGLAALFSFFLILGGAGWTGFGFGAFFLLVAARIWFVGVGTKFRLLITTSSGKAQALESHDKLAVFPLRDAIEAAMARRLDR